MIFDNNLIFAGAVSAAGALNGQLVNGAGNILSVNTIDLGPPCLGAIPGQVGEMGSGELIDISITVLSAPTVGTSVQFQLIQADDAALTVNVQVINQTDAFPIASLAVGTIVLLHFNQAAPYLPKRYVGMRFVNVGAIATCSLFAAAIKNVQSMKTVFKGGYGIA